MGRKTYLLLIILILLCTMGAFYFFAVKDDMAGNVVNTEILEVGDTVEYVNVEDGWKTRISSDWEVFDNDLGSVNIYEKGEGTIVMGTSILVTIDEASEDDFKEDTHGLKKISTKGSTAYVYDWKETEDGLYEYSGYVEIYDLPKVYSIEFDTDSTSMQGLNAKIDLLMNMLRNFEVGDKTLEEFDFVDRSDYKKKIALRGPEGIAAAISKCVSVPGFELKPYTEKISQEYATIEESKKSRFQKDFIYSGCALSAPEKSEIAIELKEKGSCKEKYKSASPEKRDVAVKTCEEINESSDYHYMMQFIRNFASPWDIKDLQYESDGNNWELWTELEDESDPECILEEGKCLYKFRNGQLTQTK